MDVGFIAIVSVVEDVGNREGILLIELPICTYDEASFFSRPTLLELRFNFISSKGRKRAVADVVFYTDARAEEVVVLVSLTVEAYFVGDNPIFPTNRNCRL